MFSKREVPDQLPPENLDTLLAAGWFRGAQTMFTTAFLNFNNQLYDAPWLRIDLDSYTQDRLAIKLASLNSRFKVSIQAASITEEKEALFDRYTGHVTFRTVKTLQELLLGPAFKGNNIFNSQEICLHDGDKLIGIGYFDLGHTAAAGITSIYDPDYRSYSIGKFLIYQKIDWCRAQNLRYFYPGYFVPGYRPFDYKLSIGRQALHYLDLADSRWKPIADFQPELAPYQLIKARLSALQQELAGSMECSLLHYGFFYVNLVEDAVGMELFDVPIFLYLGPEHEMMIKPLISFNLWTAEYEVLACDSLQCFWQADSRLFPVGTYDSHILYVAERLFTSASLTETTDFVLAIMKNPVVPDRVL